MEVSSCCGAPLISRFELDPTNFADDDYELVVKVRVCSKCNAVMNLREEEVLRQHDAAEHGFATGRTTEGDNSESAE